MAAEADRITRLESRVDTLTEQTSELRGAYEHLATKEDVANATSTVLKWMFAAIALPIWLALFGVIFLVVWG